VSFRIKGPPFGSSGLQLEFKMLLNLNLGIGWKGFEKSPRGMYENTNLYTAMTK